MARMWHEGTHTTPESAAHAFSAWRAGNPGAMDWLVRLLTPVLLRRVGTYGLDRAAAEDAVQATWLALIRHADAVRKPEAVWQWLFTTADREAWRLKRGQRSVEMVAPDALEGVRSTSSPEVWEQQRYVMHLLEQLPVRQKVICALALDGFKPNEIAERLDLDASTVRTHLQRARETLGAYLREDEAASRRHP